VDCALSLSLSLVPFTSDYSFKFDDLYQMSCSKEPVTHHGAPQLTTLSSASQDILECLSFASVPMSAAQIACKVENPIETII
jgi:hypothetical protein